MAFTYSYYDYSTPELCINCKKEAKKKAAGFCPSRPQLNFLSYGAAGTVTFSEFPQIFDPLAHIL
jgi:hypothetical protein